MPMATFSSGDAIQNPYLAAAAKSEGINYVLVNGHVVIDRGNHTGEWRYEGQDSEELVQRPSRKILLAGEQAVYQERF
jgi:hypothetical protein